MKSKVKFTKSNKKTCKLQVFLTNYFGCEYNNCINKKPCVVMSIAVHHINTGKNYFNNFLLLFQSMLLGVHKQGKLLGHICQLQCDHSYGISKCVHHHG